MDSGLWIKQFVLSKEGVAVPDLWESHSLGGWTLATHPTCGINILRIHDRHSTQIGWLLGTAISSEGEILRERFTVNVGKSDADFFHHFESDFYNLAGRFAAVVFSDQGARFYLDAAGTLAAVYSIEKPVVASSLALIPDSQFPGSDNDEELIAALDIPAKDHWYPFGLTARRSVRRLLPNHAIDLEKWIELRHWPTRDLAHLTGQDIGRAVEKIASVIERTIRSVALTQPVSMSLTAGRDSRMMLACSRSLIDRIEFNTTRIPDASARTDCRIARKMARRFGLHHRVNPWLETSEEELELWQRRTGYCVAGRTWRGARTFRESRLANRITMGGLVAEVGRSYYWIKSDLDDNRCLEPAVLVKRLHLPHVERFVECCESWCEGLPVDDRFLVLDLLYLENRVGCWATPQLYGHVGGEDSIFPFNHRAVISSMVQIPSDYRFDQRLALDVIGSRWPELLQFPFNPRGAAHRIQTFLKKVRSRVRRLLDRPS